MAATTTLNPRAAALAAWGSAWEGLRPGTIDHLLSLAAPDIRFRDPFQDVRGRDGLKRVLTHMFERVPNPRFTVTDRAFGIEAGYLRWTFAWGAGAGGKRIEGMSEVHLGADGLVTAHLDHWDSGSQFYATLPVLGPVIRLVARRVAGG
ncbi:nuclear transport factor 2 family protein [Elioraea tepida]|jgi:steroid delta-isomerase|uniref:Nuclear transport factor 2 family protein n=1 Tax=Elioraea tepida TaxID=2843330 RepID=A0A975YKB3_9PROT|nr:nuclear transport factor 2 family protein [Elioraea tepida]QXM25297.1 nuclear transport factor 2 family protein [Elioraea tepida]